MKPSIFKSIALAAIGSAGIAAIASAAIPSIASDRGAAKHFHQRGPGRMHDPFLRVVHRLDLSEEQQRSVHSLIESSHQQHTAQKQAGLAKDLSAFANPGDPSYPAAVQKAKSEALNRIQQRSDLDVQIYALLTADQKAKLPQVLADMQTRMQQRHQDREHKRGPATTS